MHKEIIDYLAPELRYTSFELPWLVCNSTQVISNEAITNTSTAYDVFTDWELN